MQVIENGAINASAAGGLLRIDLQRFTNNGTVAVTNGDTLKLNINTPADVTDGRGVISLATGANVEIGGSVAATQTLAFKDGAADVLKLDTPTTVAAAITGFAAGDTIDLVGVTATSAAWSNNALTVTESNGSSFVLDVMGSYASNNYFALSADGAGGTNITLATAAGALAGGFALAAAIEGTATTATVATFTDSNPADAASLFAATINWGDGTTSAGVVTAVTGGGFAVTAAAGHAYATEGSFAASVAVTRTSDNATLALSGAVTVGEGDAFTVKSGPALALKTGQAFTGTVATFSDVYTGNTAADLKATIVWGDGTTSVGTVTDANGLITVSGAHSYSAAGTDAISVALTDVDGSASATATGSAVVSAPSSGSTYTLTTKADTVVGGAGNNTIDAATGTLSKGDNINGGPGVNTIQLIGGGTFDLRAPTTLTNVQILQAQEGAGAAAETVDLRNGLNLTVNVANGAAGAGITINGAQDSSTINLGSGADTVTLGSTTETVNGGSGADTYKVTASTIGATIHGGSGTNTLVVSGGGTEVMGANITNIGTVDLASAGSSYHFTANATAGLVIDDLSVGNNDVIHAGAAGQTLLGGSGDQTFYGFGSGTTTYEDTAKNFNGSSIKNFNASDVIDVLGLAYNAQTALAFSASGPGAGDLNILQGGVMQGQIHLSGLFPANGFAMSSDGHGGTQISAHA